jgi:methylamine dehydrogenase accessory protein MauD
VWLVASTVLQFIVLGVLAVMVLSLARQVGILHERTAPAGLTNAAAQLEIGAPLPAVSVPNLAGVSILFGVDEANENRHEKWSALLFVAADCPICRLVLPAYDALLEDFSATLTGFWVGDGLDGEAFGRYAEEHHIDASRFFLSQELGLRLGIRALPALAILDEEQRLVSREVIATPRQLKRRFSQLAIAGVEKIT